MKKTSLLTIGISACLLFGNSLSAQQVAPLKARKQFVMPSNISSKNYLSNTIIFKLKPEFRGISSVKEVNDAKFNQVLSYIGSNKLEKKFPRHAAPEKQYNELHQKFADLSLIYELKYTNAYDLSFVINQLYATGLMEYAEPHYIYELSAFTPNDPSISNQSGFLARIRATAAWDLALGGSQGTASVVIGIVDSGTDLDHPDLVTQFTHNNADPVNGLDDDNDGYIDNYTGWDLAGANYSVVVGDNNATIMGANNDHGSHVSGCAAAATNNGVGVAGVGFNCKLLPVKCGADNDTRGTGGVGYIITGYEGITYAADHGAKIINCSWGGPGGGTYGQDIITYATINKNCLVVAAAGNTGIDEQNFPSSFKYVLCVAATNSTNDSKATFSTYNYDVDISSPGKGIYETIYNNNYASLDGTSMASPITAGGAGLVQSKFNYSNALQIGQRLKQTSDNHYVTGPNVLSPNFNSSLQNKLGKGRMNLQRALTDAASPSVVFSNESIVDHNDNAIVIGDSLFITGDFTNYLNATTNLVATITATVGGAYVTSIDNSTTLGVVNTLSTVNNNTDPFKFKINAGTPQNAKITFVVTLTDGTYTDKYFITVIVNVDYINIDINDVATTITSKGKLGYNNDGQVQGLGFTYFGNNLMYEGSLMIGTSATSVSDAFRGSTSGTADVDFQSSVVVKRTVPALFSEFDAHGRFNDALASPTQNLDVSHSAYAWTTLGNRKYVIVEYVMKNSGTTPLTNLYAGIVSDWDVDASTASANKGDYDATRKLGYVYSTATAGLYAGTKVLSSTAPALCYNIDNIAGGAGGIDVNDATNYYGTGDKYTSLSTNRFQAGTGATAGGDIIGVVSTGPYNINAGDSVKVAFALIAGDDLLDMQNSADSAQVHYDGPPPLPTGVKTITANDINLVVYPNPAGNDLNFIFNSTKSENVEIVLSNMLGQTMLTVKKNNTSIGMNSINADVSGLPNGTYFYRINNGSKTVSGKVQINK